MFLFFYLCLVCSTTTRAELRSKAHRVTDEEAVAMSRYLALYDGLFLGSSAAVNLVACVRLALSEKFGKGSGKVIVTILWSDLFFLFSSLVTCQIWSHSCERNLVIRARDIWVNFGESAIQLPIFESLLAHNFASSLIQEWWLSAEGRYSSNLLDRLYSTFGSIMIN